MKRDHLIAMYDIYIWKKLKENHNYRILNYKCSAKKTACPWMNVSIVGDQRSKNDEHKNKEGCKKIIYLFFNLDPIFVPA